MGQGPCLIRCSIRCALKQELQERRRRSEGKGRGAAGKGLQLLPRSWRGVARGARPARRAARVPRQWFIGVISYLLLSYCFASRARVAPPRVGRVRYYFIGFYARLGGRVYAHAREESNKVIIERLSPCTYSEKHLLVFYWFISFTAGGCGYILVRSNL